MRTISGTRDWTVYNNHGRCDIYNSIRRYLSMRSIYSIDYEMAHSKKKKKQKITKDDGAGPAGPVPFSQIKMKGELT